MFGQRPAKDIDIDLTAFGLPNPRENTLSALKKRAETTHTPPGGGAGAQSRAGGGGEAGRGPVRTAVPPKPALGAALDDLAHVMRPAGTAVGSRPPPVGPSADLDSLLGNLSSLAPPSGPRPGLQPTSRSTPAPRSGEEIHPLQGGSADFDFFGDSRAGPAQQPLPSPAAHPQTDGCVGRSTSHASISSGADDLDSFFAGGAPGPSVGVPPVPPVPAVAPVDTGAVAPAQRPAPGGGADVDDFFSVGTFNDASAAAAARLRRPHASSSSSDDFFTGGGIGGGGVGATAAPRVGGGAAAAVADVDLLSMPGLSGHSAAAAAPPMAPPSPPHGRPHHARGASGGGEPPSHGSTASLHDTSDPFDMFASGGAHPPQPQAPSGAGRRPTSHHTHGSSISSLDDLASFLGTGGGGGGAVPSSDPLHDVVFGSPQRKPQATAEPFHMNARGGAAAAAPSAGVHVSDSDVATAMGGTDMARQQQREEDDAAAADPNEPEERKLARRRRHEEARSRVEAAVREKLARDAMAAADAEERHAVGDAMGPKLEAWVKKGKGNIRLYLATVQDVLWEGHTWKTISLPDLVAPVQVKKAWMKVLVNIHPDKVQQRGGTTTQRFVADKVFHVMLDAYSAFASKEL